MCVCVCVCVCVCMYICMYTYIYIYIYICVFMYVCIYIYIYICNSLRFATDGSALLAGGSSKFVCLFWREGIRVSIFILVLRITCTPELSKHPSGMLLQQTALLCSRGFFHVRLPLLGLKGQPLFFFTLRIPIPNYTQAEQTSLWYAFATDGSALLAGGFSKFVCLYGVKGLASFFRFFQLPHLPFTPKLIPN